MIVTESEATTKWCPFVRESDHGYNRVSYTADPTGITEHKFNKCIGSKCMMWVDHDGESGYCGMGGDK